jgi:hypothetical protein
MTTETRNDILTVATSLRADAIQADKAGDKDRHDALLKQAASHYRDAGKAACATWCEQRIGRGAK